MESLPQDFYALCMVVFMLGLKHGSAALEHCVRLVESVRQLLDETIGS